MPPATADSTRRMRIRCRPHKGWRPGSTPCGNMPRGCRNSSVLRTGNGRRMSAIVRRYCRRLDLVITRNHMSDVRRYLLSTRLL